ncbi:hypothetical protein [Streptomyces sp. NPDC000410]|uniref:VMAP-C domain-containing protein n=1 Tax=Streptomyces sp. NPDC000410 TaxID=3154254 RepID=UPI00332A6A51
MAKQRLDEAQNAVLEDLVELLARPSGGLLDNAARGLWRKRLQDRVEGLEWRTFETPVQLFVDVVFECAAKDGGLDHLVKVTRLVTRSLDPELEQLLDEWKALRAFPGRDRDPLRRALSVSVSDLHSYVQLATGGRIQLPSHCGTPWQAFAHLADRNSFGGGLPPGMVFLEYLATCPEVASDVGEIRAWNNHFGAEWGLLDGPEGLTALRDRLGRPASATGGGGAGGGAGEGRAAPVATRPLIRAYIKVVPDRTPIGGAGRRRERKASRYYVSGCVKYADSSSLYQDARTASENPVQRGQLPYSVADLLSRMAQLWHDRAENVALDFFLPAELLNEPVEWWDRDPSRPYPNSLLSKYREITLHSLERVQRREFHRAWRARWAWWKSGEGKEIVYESDPKSLVDEEHLARLDAEIGRTDDVVGMVLSRPPADREGLGVREVSLALDLGVPIVIYHRDDSASEVFRSMIRESLANDGLVSFPERAQQWKADAAVGRAAARDSSSDSGSDSDSDVIRSMSMIWDDPEHLLDGGPSAPVTFVGGTD